VALSCVLLCLTDIGGTELCVLLCLTDVGGTEQRTHVIPTNFTLRNKEQQLSYFTEDVGLNMYNLLWRYMSPSWFNVTEYGHKISRRGEKFYNFYKQLYARYILERLSNHMTDVEPFAWNRPLKVLLPVQCQIFPS
jgi:hypothetical protein